jgi:lysophospholipase L1-like esterase
VNRAPRLQAWHRALRGALLTGLLAMHTTSVFATGHALRYLALGDSYTIGEAVPESGRWPEQLAERLRRDGFALGSPRIIATTGWTTDELSAAMDAAEPLGEWDLVSLLIGVNNQYRGREVEEFRREFRALLARAIRLARGHARSVLVLSIPDWGVTPFGAASGRDRAQIAQQLDRYNAVVRDEAQRAGARFVDIAPVSRARGAQLVAHDGLHPSAELYAEWTALALPVARGMLQEQAAARE